MGDVDGAVAYCHAAVPVCPKAPPLRFAPVATPPMSLDSRRAVTARLLLLLLSILLTPPPLSILLTTPPSKDDKASEYDIGDTPDILAPCLLPCPPTPSPHHTREGAGRVRKAASKTLKAASKTHPHWCSMAQHGSYAHYFAKGQAARAHSVTFAIICMFPPRLIGNLTDGQVYDRWTVVWQMDMWVCRRWTCVYVHLGIDLSLQDHGQLVTSKPLHHE